MRQYQVDIFALLRCVVSRHDMAPITDGKYSVECYLDVPWAMKQFLYMFGVQKRSWFPKAF